MAIKAQDQHLKDQIPQINELNERLSVQDPNARVTKILCTNLQALHKAERDPEIHPLLIRGDTKRAISLKGLVFMCHKLI